MLFLIEARIISLDLVAGVVCFEGSEAGFRGTTGQFRQFARTDGRVDFGLRLPPVLPSLWVGMMVMLEPDSMHNRIKFWGLKDNYLQVITKG